MAASRRNRFVLRCLIILAPLASLPVGAQNPLERRVTLTKKQSPVAEILREIETKASLSFSYNPEQVHDKAVVDVSFDNKPVRFILDRIFKGWVEYRSKGNYIILQPSRKVPAPKPKLEKIRISGYVLDASDGTYLKAVTVFDTIAFYSATSDENGHFEMVLGENSTALFLMVKKQGYLDTSYFIPRETFQSVELRLTPISTAPEIPVIEVVPPKDSVEEVTATDTQLIDSLPRLKWKAGMKEAREDMLRFGHMVNKKLRFNTRNVDDTFFRRVQFSLVPGVSTNRLLSGSVVNDYSLNLLGGYSKGVNVLEIGGLFNLNEGDVRYAQLAGLFNGVGGEVRGVQAAGLFNLSEKSFRGAQLSGIFNANSGPFLGAQAAGILNVNSGYFEGTQLAGITSLNKGTFKGFQASGIGNFNEGTFQGLQVAGIVNAADTVQGMQLAGIVNIAARVKGVQLGLINISDTLNGVPIGLWSSVKKGYHKLEIGCDELFYTRIGWRSGSHWFHNIIQVGMDPRTIGEPLWSVGYGIGTSIPLRRSYWDIDLTTNWVSKGDFELYTSSLYQLYTGPDIRITQKFYLSAGITLNMYLADKENPQFAEHFNSLYAGTRNSYNIRDNHQLQSWIGARVALRFF